MIERNPICVKLPMMADQLPGHGAQTTDMQMFAAEFACLVTVFSDDLNDMVARNGSESIYALLMKMLPEVNLMRYFESNFLILDTSK